MKSLHVLGMATAMLWANTAMAGGLLTNTNQNIAFNRNFAREGALGIDGAYSNPAGVAFLGRGFHLSFNVQNVYQTRVITSGMDVPSLSGTPFYQPLKLNGADQNGVKQYKGKASVPILPSFQAALNYDNWGFQLGFALHGGGGKASFNDGLGSFERQVALIPALLYSQGITTDAPAYSMTSYMNGQQYDYGVQLGTTYKFNKHLSVYAGFRFNYIFNHYQGSISGISASIGGTMQNLHDYFGDQASTLNLMAFYYNMRAAEITDPQTKAQYLATAQKYKQGAEQMTQAQTQFADRNLDCTQRGWGITPIIGVDYRTGKWNFGARYEFTTKFNIENNTKVDDTGMFQDGVNTHNDLPGILAFGAQYEVTKTLRAMASYHYFFDKDARMDRNKQRALSDNTQEYLAGMEWDVLPAVTVSAGGQRTKYGLGDGGYLSDMSFVTSSYSVGFGAKISIAKNAKLNIAYFWTHYEHFKKSYDQTIAAAGQSVDVHNTDDFTRTNKVLGVGLDIDF